VHQYPVVSIVVGAASPMGELSSRTHEAGSARDGADQAFDFRKSNSN